MRRLISAPYLQKKIGAPKDVRDLIISQPDIRAAIDHTVKNGLLAAFIQKNQSEIVRQRTLNSNSTLMEILKTITGYDKFLGRLKPAQEISNLETGDIPIKSLSHWQTELNWHLANLMTTPEGGTSLFSLWMAASKNLSPDQLKVFESEALFPVWASQLSRILSSAMTRSTVGHTSSSEEEKADDPASRLREIHQTIQGLESIIPISRGFSTIQTEHLRLKVQLTDDPYQYYNYANVRVLELQEAKVDITSQSEDTLIRLIGLDIIKEDSNSVARESVAGLWTLYHTISKDMCDHILNKLAKHWVQTLDRAAGSDSVAKCVLMHPNESFRADLVTHIQREAETTLKGLLDAKGRNFSPDQFRNAINRFVERTRELTNTAPGSTQNALAAVVRAIMGAVTVFETQFQSSPSVTGWGYIHPDTPQSNLYRDLTRTWLDAYLSVLPHMATPKDAPHTVLKQAMTLTNVHHTLDWLADQLTTHEDIFSTAFKSFADHLVTRGIELTNERDLIIRRSALQRPIRFTGTTQSVAEALHRLKESLPSDDPSTRISDDPSTRIKDVITKLLDGHNQEFVSSRDLLISVNEIQRDLTVENVTPRIGRRLTMFGTEGSDPSGLTRNAARLLQWFLTEGELGLALYNHRSDILPGRLAATATTAQNALWVTTKEPISQWDVVRKVGHRISNPNKSVTDTIDRILGVLGNDPSVKELTALLTSIKSRGGVTVADIFQVKGTVEHLLTDSSPASREALELIRTVSNTLIAKLRTIDSNFSIPNLDAELREIQGPRSRTPNPEIGRGLSLDRHPGGVMSEDVRQPLLPPGNSVGQSTNNPALEPVTTWHEAPRDDSHTIQSFLASWDVRATERAVGSTHDYIITEVMQTIGQHLFEPSRSADAFERDINRLKPLIQGVMQDLLPRGSDRSTDAITAEIITNMTAAIKALLPSSQETTREADSLSPAIRQAIRLGRDSHGAHLSAFEASQTIISHRITDVLLNALGPDSVSSESTSMTVNPMAIQGTLTGPGRRDLLSPHITPRTATALLVALIDQLESHFDRKTLPEKVFLNRITPIIESIGVPLATIVTRPQTYRINPSLDRPMDPNDLFKRFSESGIIASLGSTDGVKNLGPFERMRALTSPNIQRPIDPNGKLKSLASTWVSYGRQKELRDWVNTIVPLERGFDELERRLRNRPFILESGHQVSFQEIAPPIRKLVTEARKLSPNYRAIQTAVDQLTRQVVPTINVDEIAQRTGIRVSMPLGQWVTHGLHALLATAQATLHETLTETINGFTADTLFNRTTGLITIPPDTIQQMHALRILEAMIKLTAGGAESGVEDPPRGSTTLIKKCTTLARSVLDDGNVPTSFRTLCLTGPASIFFNIPEVAKQPAHRIINQLRHKITADHLNAYVATVTDGDWAGNVDTAHGSFLSAVTESTEDRPEVVGWLLTVELTESTPRQRTLVQEVWNQIRPRCWNDGDGRPETYRLYQAAISRVFGDRGAIQLEQLNNDFIFSQHLNIEACVDSIGAITSKLQYKKRLLEKRRDESALEPSTSRLSLVDDLSGTDESIGQLGTEIDKLASLVHGFQDLNLLIPPYTMTCLQRLTRMHSPFAATVFGQAKLIESDQIIDKRPMDGLTAFLEGSYYDRSPKLYTPIFQKISSHRITRDKFEEASQSCSLGGDSLETWDPKEFKKVAIRTLAMLKASQTKGPVHR
ncbi:hypothetical protein EB093_03185 [bacterium]|nr:hypothetical protein [bacterium]